MRFPVSEAKQADLQIRMQKLGITENDLAESFIHGSGAGGQKINKTSVVVVIRHIPSGVEVRCQQSRSQALNRFLARRILVEKMAEKTASALSRRIQEREKIRRQKRKRNKRAKDKMLSDKKKHGEKKKLRNRHTQTAT